MASPMVCQAKMSCIFTMRGERDAGLQLPLSLVALKMKMNDELSNNPFTT